MNSICHPPGDLVEGHPIRSCRWDTPKKLLQVPGDHLLEVGVGGEALSRSLGTFLSWVLFALMG